MLLGFISLIQALLVHAASFFDPVLGHIQVLQPSLDMKDDPGLHFEIFTAQAMSVQPAFFFSPLEGQKQVLHPSSARKDLPGVQVVALTV